MKEAPTGLKPQVVSIMEGLIVKHPHVLTNAASALEAKEAVEALQEEAEDEAEAMEATNVVGILETTPQGPKSEFVERNWRYKIGEQVEALFKGYAASPQWIPCVVQSRRNAELKDLGLCDGYKVAPPPDALGPEEEAWVTNVYPAKGEIRRPGATDVCNARCRIACKECKCTTQTEGGTLTEPLNSEAGDAETPPPEEPA